MRVAAMSIASAEVLALTSSEPSSVSSDKVAGCDLKQQRR
jgi:hypothetical protein